MPATILAIAWSGMDGNGRLQNAEEVQVGGVAEVEELEVVLPQLEGQVEQPVVVLHSRSSPEPVPCPSVMTAMSSRLRQRREAIVSISSTSARTFGSHSAYSWSQLAK